MEIKNGNENGNMSSMVNEAIGNIYIFFLRENFISIKSTKSIKSTTRHI